MGLVGKADWNGYEVKRTLCSYSMRSHPFLLTIGGFTECGIRWEEKRRNARLDIDSRNSNTVTLCSHNMQLEVGS